ncbi:caspase-8 [Paramuricea clavata]|uniref:Caspase-8 n=2 Tax=Paramuricea clavata TaxID=317549 RepID=A0A7D9EV71_PARCT|nr:caspase-8 [Paramuricea clavata]
MNPPYGTALIINVQHFHGTTKEGVTLDLRRGSHIDFENLKQAWKQFGFDVVAYEDLKADEIRTVAQDTANKINKNSSIFVSAITTHGDRGKIYGSDSEYLEIKEVTDAFKTTKCPSLAGKPKLFIIVASGVRQNFTGGSILPAVGLTNPTATLETDSGDPNTPVAGVTTDAPARCEPAPMIGLTNAVKPGGGDDDDYDHMNDSIFREKLDPDEPHFLIAISLAPDKPVTGYQSQLHSGKGGVSVNLFNS